MNDRLLTIPEVAELLHLKPKTVRRYCREGRIQAVKLGKEWRIRASQLEAALR